MNEERVFITGPGFHKQRFLPLMFVRVSARMPPHMSHFPCVCDAWEPVLTVELVKEH